MKTKLITDFEARKRVLGGNPQINVRLNAEWTERLQQLLREEEGAATLIKDWLYPLLTGVVVCERDESGKVVAITGLDDEGKRITIRCDGKPAVRGAKPLPTAPTRGRPRKPREPGDE